MGLKKLFKTLRNALRKFRIPVYWLRGNKISWDSFISSNVFLRQCKIGKYCYIGGKCVLNRAIIGNYSSIASSVHIGGMEHSYWELSTSTYLSDSGVIDKATIIDNDVWIGAGCIVKQGVHIGTGAVIGAHSFVNKDVEPFAIAFGSPAKVYKFRFEQGICDALIDSRYWEHEPLEARRILEGIKKIHSNNEHK